MRHGFTLIELAIVLVIVGLIVGGVLMGRDLIAAATVRAQIAQIEKYNTAVNTFKEKYSYLPGDIRDPDAGRFGFAARGASAGEGDGNGILEGINVFSGNANCGNYQTGENSLFWEDLSTAKLLDGSFTQATATGDIEVFTQQDIAGYFPASKIGNGFVTTFSYYGTNYFQIGTMGAVSGGATGTFGAMTPTQASAIDKKIDDGFAESGRVMAMVGSTTCFTPAFTATWVMTLNSEGGSGTAPPTAATAGSATTCIDNNNSVGAMNYSVAQNSGSNNCAISLRFQ